MKGSVRFILALVLLMLSYSMGGNAMDITSCVSKSESSCQLSESNADTNSNSSFKTRSNNYRLRRIIEANDSLKDVMHKFFLLRENSLVLDQSKSYYSDKDPHYSIICSDYYVFALRHILI